MAAKEDIHFPSGPTQRATIGSAGLATQIPGGCATVSAAAMSTGGVRRGGLIETDK